jgi:hydrogenase maturation protease
VIPHASAVPPVLVLGWGNPSRGDDALGPMLVERLRSDCALNPRVECLDDYQLQIEHALDLVGRERVLFVDASRSDESPFSAFPLQARRDASFSTHRLSPQAVMQVFEELQGRQSPSCTLLSIRATSFELGDPPCEQALCALEAAHQWARAWLRESSPG